MTPRPRSRTRTRTRTRTPLRRLRFGTAAALLLSLAATACADGAGDGTPGTDAQQDAADRPVTILGNWTGSEAEAFRDLLDSAHIPYVYQGTAAQREVLLSQVQAGAPPDIAVMPSPGELADYARKGQLKPLDGLFSSADYGAPWQPSTRDSTHRYWVPLKADLKSIVWYRKGDRPAPAPHPAASWCIGMGDDGASGWPGTDWIEDMMLQRYGPGAYARWADGATVWTDKKIAGVFRDWGGMLAGDGTGEGHAAAATRALLSDRRGGVDEDGLLFGDGKRKAAGTPRCSLEHQGSFARTFYNERSADARFTLSPALLPGGPYRRRGFEVTADFAALFNKTPAAKKLLSYLASTTAQRRWAKESSPPTHFFTADSRAPRGHGDPTSQRIASLLTDPDTVHCLDASDAMPPAVRDAFCEAVLRFLGNPAGDPEPLLKGVQKVQKTEQQKLSRQHQLGQDGTWLKGVCSN